MDPLHSPPGDVASGDTAPGDTAPGDAAPGDAASGGLGPARSKDDAEELVKHGDFLWAQALDAVDTEAALTLLAEATQCYALANRNDPEDPIALNNWGNVLSARAQLETDEEVQTSLLDSALRRLMMAEHLLPGCAAYNLACLHALRGEEDEVLRWLGVGKELRELPPRETFEADSDFQSLRGRDWFESFLTELDEA